LRLPEAVTIENAAFYDCIALETLYLPKVKTIGNAAFQNCDSLSIVTFGSKAPTIDYYMQFYDVKDQKTITVKVPQGAKGYDPAWKEAFTGIGVLNNITNITVYIEYGTESP
jgi:hypothetical protein